MADNKERKVLFKIKDLQQWFPIKKGMLKKTVGHVKAVDGISLEIYKGETLGIVGESGCGKSTFGKSIMMLERPTGGEVLFNFGGEFKDITKFSSKEMLEFRKRVQMVFQDPYSALNPQKKIYTAFEEPLKVHGINTKEEREKIMAEVLRMVNIQPDYLLRYPHEFSGGQRQRIGVARSVIMNPELIIADEPVSALDVSVQAQVINLLNELREKFGLTILFIAHDLSVVKYFSDRIGVMYFGKMVEMASSDELFAHPLHPYTKSLLSAIPLPDPVYEKKRQRITYNPLAEHDYSVDKPSFREVAPGHFVQCNDAEFAKYQQELRK